MATLEDDISVLSCLSDRTEDFTDEADNLLRHFDVHSQIPSSEDTASFQVFRKAYQDLKTQHNKLYIKSQAQEKKLKDYENRRLSVSEDQTGSFIYVADPSMESSKSENAALEKLVTDLKMKLNKSENSVRTLKIDNNQLEHKIIELQDELKQENVQILQDKLKRLTTKLVKYESTDSDDIHKQFEKLKAENLELLKEKRKLTEDNLMFKRKAYAADSNPVILNNGTAMTMGSALPAPKDLVSDQQFDWSLNSSLPAVNELDQLKQVIKKLKSVVQTQNAYLLNLDRNPAVRKAIQAEKIHITKESLNRISNSAGASTSRGSNPNLNNGISTDSADGCAGHWAEDGLGGVRYGQCHSPVEQMDISVSNTQHRPERLQVNLPEQYDNVKTHSPTRSLRQLQAKSHSEVIVRATNGHQDLQRSHSLSNRNSISPSFGKESAIVSNVINVENPYRNVRAGFGSAVDPIVLGAASSPLARSDPERVPSLKKCPVCNEDFTYKSVSAFQTHVFNCVDSEEQPNTLTIESVPERICPICNHMFPASFPQNEVENHVNAHFGETPADEFEILNA